MPENDMEKVKVKIEDLPVPVKDSNADEQEEVKGGMGAFNPTTPSHLNPTLSRKPITDQY